MVCMLEHMLLRECLDCMLMLLSCLLSLCTMDVSVCVCVCVSVCGRCVCCVCVSVCVRCVCVVCVFASVCVVSMCVSLCVSACLLILLVEECWRVAKSRPIPWAAHRGPGDAKKKFHHLKATHVKMCKDRLWRLPMRRESGKDASRWRRP